jgi:chromosome segregation ATPase
MTICLSPPSDQVEDATIIDKLSRDESNSETNDAIQQLMEENRKLREEHKRERKIRDALNLHLTNMKNEVAELKTFIPLCRQEIDLLKKETEELQQKRIDAEKENILAQYKLRKTQFQGSKLKASIKAENDKNKQLQKELDTEETRSSVDRLNITL